MTDSAHTDRPIRCVRCGRTIETLTAHTMHVTRRRCSIIDTEGDAESADYAHAFGELARVDADGKDPETGANDRHTLEHQGHPRRAGSDRRTRRARLGAMRAPVSGSATLRELPGVIAFRPIKAPAADRAIVGPIGSGSTTSPTNWTSCTRQNTTTTTAPAVPGSAPATSRRPRTCSRPTRTTCATSWRLAYSANGSGSRSS